MQSKACIHVDLAPNMQTYLAKYFTFVLTAHHNNKSTNVKYKNKHTTPPIHLPTYSPIHQPPTNILHTQTYPTTHPFTHPPIHPLTTTHPHIQIQFLKPQQLSRTNTEQNLPARPYQSHNIYIYIYICIYKYIYIYINIYIYICI